MFTEGCTKQGWITHLNRIMYKNEEELSKLRADLEAAFKRFEVCSSHHKYMTTLSRDYHQFQSQVRIEKALNTVRTTTNTNLATSNVIQTTTNAILTTTQTALTATNTILAAAETGASRPYLVTSEILIRSQRNTPKSQAGVFCAIQLT
jgi:hypothetical protein